MGIAVARSRLVRLGLGALVGATLLVVILARVDLASVAAVIAGASVPALALAVAIVLLDLVIRGLRWQGLIAGLGTEGRARLPLATAYLTIGYLANVLLPARLGDLARAYLAGAAFRLPRLATLGTIVVERVADGTTMLGLAVLASLLVAGIPAVQALAAFGLLLAAAGGAGVGIAWWVTMRTAFGRSGPGRLVRDLAARLAVGTAAARTPRGAAALVLTTAAGTTTAILVAWIVPGSVGVALTPAQAALFMSAIALSLAVPAAPGSLGTYEFVGVVVLTSLGHSAERAFAAIVLMRAVSTFPPIALGIVATWLLHLRPGAILETAGALSATGRDGRRSA